MDNSIHSNSYNNFLERLPICFEVWRDVADACDFIYKQLLTENISPDLFL